MNSAMKINLCACLVFLILSGAFVVSSGMGKDLSEQRVELTGILSYAGNVPFQKPVFRTSGGKTYEIVQKDSENLRSLVGEKIRINGTSGSILMETADKKIRSRIFYLREVSLLYLVPGTVPDHLKWARILVKEISPGLNSYRHKNTVLRIQGLNKSESTVHHADCSAFLTGLLNQCYGLKRHDIKKWFGSKRPRARHFYQAITRNKGFVCRQRIQDILPGDIISVYYPVPDESRNTGHLMIADTKALLMDSGKKDENGLLQWEIAVIDASLSPHGKKDTRYKDGLKLSGAGRGHLRLYADSRGLIAGYSWSTEKKSKFIPSGTRPVAVGMPVIGM